MRSPPWVVPRQIPPFGEKGWEKWSPWLCSNVPGFEKTIRYLIATGAEYDWRLFGSEDYHAKERKKLEDQLLAHMKKTVPKKYHEILTPDYGVGCKRRIFDATVRIIPCSHIFRTHPKGASCPQSTLKILQNRKLLTFRSSSGFLRYTIPKSS
jgi:hypothetical protein